MKFMGSCLKGKYQLERVLFIRLCTIVTIFARTVLEINGGYKRKSVQALKRRDLDAFIPFYFPGNYRQKSSPR